MKLKCISNDHEDSKNNKVIKIISITIGKEYKIIKDTGNHYFITDDNGQSFGYQKKFFEEIEEMRNRKLLKLIDS